MNRFKQRLPLNLYKSPLHTSYLYCERKEGMNKSFVSKRATISYSLCFDGGLTTVWYISLHIGHRSCIYMHFSTIVLSIVHQVGHTDHRFVLSVVKLSPRLGSAPGIRFFPTSSFLVNRLSTLITRGYHYNFNIICHFGMWKRMIITEMVNNTNTLAEWVYQSDDNILVSFLHPIIAQWQYADATDRNGGFEGRRVSFLWKHNGWLLANHDSWVLICLVSLAILREFVFQSE